MIPSPSRLTVLALLALALMAALAAPAAVPAAASPWTRFEVPDSALAPTLAAARADLNGFEAAWNALFVAELRAGAARADSARRLLALERRIAKAEPGALGSRIGADALALRGRWKAVDRARRVEAAVIESLAVAARTAGDVPRADSVFRAAIDAYTVLGERRREAWVLGSLGSLRLVAGDHTAALEAYTRALVARRALGDPRLIGNTLNDLGQTYYVLGRRVEAYGFLREAAEIRERTNQLAALSNTLGFLGSTLGALGRPDSAKTCFRRAIELASAAGDSTRLLTVLVNHAALLGDLGERDEAIEVSRHARAIAIARGDDTRRATLEGNLADLLRESGRFSESVEHYQRALELQRDDPRRTARSLCDLGAALNAMGDPDRARAVLARAAALADSIGDPARRTAVLVGQSEVAQTLGDASGAQRLARRALEQAGASGDSTMTRLASLALGRLLIEAGQYAEAGPYLERSFVAMPSLPTGQGLVARLNRALAWHLTGRMDDAEREYRVVLAEGARSGNADAVMAAYTDLGDIAERRARPAEALDFYARALAVADSLRAMQRSDRDAIKTLAERAAAFEAMIHLLVKRSRVDPDSGFAERAFEWAERSRARAFLDLAAGAAGRDARPIGLAAAQRLLGDDEALLEYSVGDSSTTLWVVRRARWSCVTLPARAGLRARVLSLRRALADPATATGAAARVTSRVLYDALVAPVAARLDGVTRLVVSPDGPLVAIPFEALLAPPARGATGPPRYLAERYAVSYAPSASALALLQSGAATRPGPIVALGDPAFGDQPVAGLDPLPRLPATASELRVLAALGGTRAHVSLDRGGATREALLALDELPRAEVLHLASHGTVNEAEPDRSGLWLAAAGDGPPGRLEARDIMRLRLAAQLVTLSACETGLGRIERGEGVVGLARAFLAAGARSVLVSLWSVNDASTASLMEAFYRRALDGRTDRVEALAAAKRMMIADPKTRSPFYWAPFVMIGASGPLP